MEVAGLVMGPVSNITQKQVNGWHALLVKDLVYARNVKAQDIRIAVYAKAAVIALIVAEAENAIRVMGIQYVAVAAAMVIVLPAKTVTANA